MWHNVRCNTEMEESCLCEYLQILKADGISGFYLKETLSQHIN